jgi:hypothetical protein
VLRGLSGSDNRDHFVAVFIQDHKVQDQPCSCASNTGFSSEIQGSMNLPLHILKTETSEVEEDIF